MATIEERAHQYGCNAAGGHYQGGMRGAVYDANKSAYIEIATEQREIDIQKACDAIWTYVEQSPDFVVENYQDRYEFHYERMARDIRNVVRKAMEE